jgi:NADH dehydrogenase
MIRTLVTGGTGFIGSRITSHLLNHSETVRVMTRNPQCVSRTRRFAGTEFVKGDVFDDASLDRALRGEDPQRDSCDAVVHAVQFENAPFEHPSKGRTYERVDGEGTERVVAAAKRAGIKRLIYISGAGTREGRSEPWFRAKLRAEKAVRESGMDWTIIRPSWVYGPEDVSLNKFATFARFLPFVPLIGMGNEKIQPLFVDDLARAIQLSLNNEKTFPKIFDIGGPEELTMKEIVRILLRTMGKSRILLPQPKFLMKILARFIQYLPGRPLTPDGVDFVTMEEKVDNSALLSTITLNLTRLEDGLSQYIGKPQNLLKDQSRRYAL